MKRSYPLYVGFLALLVFLPGPLRATEVIFADDFQRPDAATAGPKWEEYIVRRDENGTPRAGETPWCVKNGSLFFSYTGVNSYVEDFIQSREELPADNVRVEFDLLATGGTSQGYVGPSCFLAPNARFRNGASGVSADAGAWLMGVEAWYRWENKGTRGLLLMANGVNKDYPDAVFSGFNESQFAHHVFEIRNGTITYSSPAFSPVTLSLAKPLGPGARRHLSFGARLYDAGIVGTIAIRNVKVTALTDNAATAADTPSVPEGELTRRLEAFLAACEANRKPAARNLLTPGMQREIGNSDLAAFGQSLNSFRRQGVEKIVIVRRQGTTTEAIAVLKNALGQQVSLNLLFRDALIDQCVAHWGVQ